MRVGLKKDWQQRIDAFKLWCWIRLLRVPWIARKSNQSILKEVNPEYSLEGLKVKLQYFGRWLTGKDLYAGKDWGQEEKGTTEDEMVGRYHGLKGHKFEQTPGDSQGQGSLAWCSLWGRKESDTTERLNNNPKNINAHLKPSNSTSWNSGYTGIHT